MLQLVSSRLPLRFRQLPGREGLQEQEREQERQEEEAAEKEEAEARQRRRPAGLLLHFLGHRLVRHPLHYPGQRQLQ